MSLPRLYNLSGCAEGRGRRFAGAAVPSELSIGAGIDAVMFVGSPLARLARRAVVAVGSWNEAKKGVSSPSKGALLPSVVFPRKIISSVLGGAGDGEGAARACRKCSRINAPTDTAFAARFVVFEATAALLLSKVISITMFGWSGLLGFTEFCISFGSAQLQRVVGATQPLSSTTASGWAIVKTPVGIGGRFETVSKLEDDPPPG